ncbi:winged helix-turn-helix domain-containing protein [Methanothermococcus sp.]|uniref:winged helix-turn-helix domain-containing protein n=1 Tax=Methanothermococcus sp. TaxID=2614238 RepID=UPI0025E9B2DF|nr:winged helix-turn-helix domain-containing protein [Methanothermococcus sp.]
MTRWTAYKIQPEEFLNNEVNEKALIIDGKRIHRVRLLGNVKNISVSTILSFELDGVSVRDFEKKAEDIEEGDFVDIIGRVGMYEGSKYIALEVYKKRNEDKEKWKELRALEIEKTRKYLEDEESSLISGKRENTDITDDILEDIYRDEESQKDIILNIINENEGISYEELVKKANIDEKELDKILEELIEDGEIYEPKTGTYMIL